MIFDCHADILTDIYKQRRTGMKNVFKKRHLDNFKLGQVKGGIFVIWIDPYNTLDAREDLIQTLKHVSSEIIEDKELFNIIINKGDLKVDKGSEKINMIMGIEGLGCIGEDLNLINLLYIYGIRHVSLTWNETNKLGTGVDGDENSGLTLLGKQLIKKLEERNMIIDLSHANEKTFWDIVDIATKPVIASHSNCKSLCNHKRNLTDLQIKAIADSGGLIGMNIHKNFVSEDEDSQTIARFIDHIDHVVSLVGIDHVGFGFDFCEYLDDFKDTNIKGLKDISQVQKLIKILKIRGYGDTDIQKISYRNFENIINKIL